MKAIFIFLMLASAHLPSAFAESEDGVVRYDVTEKLDQAHLDQYIFSLAPDYGHYTYVASNGINTGNSESLGLALEYGLTKNYSIELRDSYGTASFSSGNQTATGFSDFHVAIKSMFDLNKSSELFALVDFGISLVHQSESNRYSGGNSYLAQIAYQHRLDSKSLIAVGLSESFLAPITSDVGTSSITQSSGKFVTSIFATYEKSFAYQKWGAVFDIDHGATGADLSTVINISAYVVFEIEKDLSLRPEIRYSGVSDALFKNKAYKQDEQADALMTARLAF